MPYCHCPECGKPMEVEMTDNGVAMVLHGVHCGWGHQFGPDDGYPTEDAAKAALVAAECGQLAARMRSRVDAMIERDGSVDAAVTGRGVGIGFLLAREVMHALEAASALLEAK